MLRRVTIERFRGFRRLEVDLDRITVLLGPNSSGKTSVLHAVRLACDAVELALDAPDASPRAEADRIMVCSAKDTILADPTRLAPLADFRQLFVDGEVTDGTDLAIVLDFTASSFVNQVAVRLVYSRNAQIKLEVSILSKYIMDSIGHLKPRAKGRPAKIREELDRVRPLATFVPAFYGVTRTEEYRTQPLVTRMLGGGDQSHIVRNLVARLDGDALERLNNFLRRTIGTELVDRTSTQDVERRADLMVTYRDTNGRLEISSAGAGVISLVALFAALERARLNRAAAPDRDVIFLLDEPEAHLHPRLAADVAEGIASAASDFGVQLSLATHSVDVVNRLGRRGDVAVLSIDRARTKPLSLRSEQELVQALDAFCDLTPFTSLSFLASRHLLLVEGPTDRRFLDACARVLYQSDDARRARFASFVVVELEGSGNVSAKGVLKKLLAPQVIPRVEAKRPVLVGVVLDRDWIREPRAPVRETVAPHFDAIEVVWSAHSIESLFLEPAILAAWIEASAGPTANLQKLIADAIAGADHDQALEDEAIDGRHAYHRRADPKTRAALIEREAQKRAREDVRSSPGTFQHGKRRASRVLDPLREPLGLRGSLVDLIASTPPAKLNPQQAVPAEIRAFLDALTAP